jgi:hypothetical protein
MQKLTSVPEVDFIKDSHQYFRSGIEYTSQSHFVKIFEPGFPEAALKGCARSNGITVEAQRAIWDKKKDDAADHGNIIHDMLEKYFLGHPVDAKYLCLCEQVRTLIQPSRIVFPEKIFYYDDLRIAGTADLPSERGVAGGRQILDIFDYKTNVSKGITLYTSKLKEDGKWSHYGDRWFLKPIDHLEHTLFNKYALQLSIYMYMAEVAYGVIPGRMALLYIDSELNCRPMAVPYLKYEVKAMFEYYSQLKIT